MDHYAIKMLIEEAHAGWCIVKQETVAKVAGNSSSARTVDRLRVLRRFTRENAPEVLALLAGAALWEVLGWSLGLQWLPPFSKVMEALAQFVGSGVIVANLGSSLQGLIVGFSLALILGLFLGSLMLLAGIQANCGVAIGSERKASRLMKNRSCRVGLFGRILGTPMSRMSSAHEAKN